MILGSRKRHGDQHKLRVKILRYLFVIEYVTVKCHEKEKHTEEKLNKTRSTGNSVITNSKRVKWLVAYLKVT